MQSSSVVVDSPKPAHAQCDPEHAVYRATTAADRHMVRTHDKHSYRTQLYSASSQTLSTRLGLSQLSWPAQRVTREAARPSLVSCENNAVKYSKFQLSVERHPGSHWFCFTLLCDWSRNVALLSQPIKDKTKTNHVLVAAFPALWLAAVIAVVLVFTTLNRKALQSAFRLRFVRSTPE